MYSILTAHVQTRVNLPHLSLVIRASKLKTCGLQHTFRRPLLRVGMYIEGLGDRERAETPCLDTLSPNPNPNTSWSSRVYAREEGRAWMLYRLLELMTIDFFSLETANDSFLRALIGAIFSTGFVSNSFIAAPIPLFVGTASNEL